MVLLVLRAVLDIVFVEALQQIAVLAEWLRGALDADAVAAALALHVPEFASGMLLIRSCQIKRLILPNSSGRWVGTYTVTATDQASETEQVVTLQGTVTAPRLREAGSPPEDSAGPQFGAAGWHCYMPELGLALEPQPADAVLAALPQLTDPEQSRALLEQALAQGPRAYYAVKLAACRPEILSYKPGSRAVIRYHLAYAAAPTALAALAPTVIAKTYRKASKAENAFQGMQALWQSALAASPLVRIAEPLAYIPELKLLVQAPLPEEQTLEDCLRAELRDGQHAAELERYTRKAAVGLAAFHRSGVVHGAPVTLEGRFPELRALIERLAVPLPEIAALAAPILVWLETQALRYPADAPVPTHGTFNPEQVLISQDTIGFIDFDDFCMAEPAMDVGLFCAAVKDTGMQVGDAAFLGDRAARLARLDQLDALCELFVAEYAAHAPISRQRVGLWQALDFLRNCLHFWIKAKPAEPDTAMLVLEQLLRRLEEGLPDTVARE